MSIYQGLCGSGSGVCAAWKGEVGDDRLFFGTFDGTKWDLPGNTIPGNSSVGPALAAMANGLIYAAWKGEPDADSECGQQHRTVARGYREQTIRRVGRREQRPEHAFRLVRPVQR
jgi:hypothetical protein